CKNYNIFSGCCANSLHCYLVYCFDLILCRHYLSEAAKNKYFPSNGLFQKEIKPLYVEVGELRKQVLFFDRRGFYIKLNMFMVLKSKPSMSVCALWIVSDL
ncbi:hypothetical protein, partial [Ruthenibacterium lactatiformans]|uniref:hypothetical protein n=1 Tax=Ruthenibacterium lactatiformans TaxID=1550024 RepID=UPI001966EF12